MHPFPRGMRLGLVSLAAATVLAACGDDQTPATSPALNPGQPVFAISVSSTNFQQCANGSTGTSPCTYINGVLNASKSAYHESEVIAERFVIPGLTVGHTYRLAFDYGWEKAVGPGHMNYDFLAGWNTTLGTLANPCGDPLGNGSADIRGVCNADGTIKSTHTGAGAGTQNIPDAIFTTNAPLGLSTELQAALTRLKTVLGANAIRFDILGGSFPAGAFDNVTYNVSGDNVTGRFTVRFTASQTTAMLLWGGHFADTRDYNLAIWDDDKNAGTPEHQGNLTGAAGQSGAPFQFSQVYIKNLNTGDSTGIGSLSNNIQGSVLQAVPKAKIAIAASATNGIGEPHTFTVTLQKDLDDGQGYRAASGEHVDVTLTPAGGAVVQIDAAASTCDNAGANTDANGQCTIKFTSNSGGTVTGSASATLTLNGSPVTVTTNGTGDNSSTVVKTFVAGTIRWLKHNASSQLLGGAVFTVCRTDVWSSTLNGGAGGYTDVTDVCFDVTDNVSGTDNTSAPPADRDGTAGEFELGGLILGKYTVKEKTAPAGYVLDPDTENADLSTTTASVTIATPFVNRAPDAFITIGPNTATNGLNQQHTFTAVATALPDGGTPVVIGQIAITVSPTPSSLGAVSCQAQSGNTRTCTLTINSSASGTFTANASVTVTVGGVSLNRDTDPATTDGAGPGGSGPATKVYLGGELTWTKVDGTNGNALLGGAKFTVCRTGAPPCFDVMDNVSPDLDAAAGKFKLGGLTLGEYTVTETLAPAGYNLDPNSQVALLTTANPIAALANAFVNTKPDAYITISPNSATNGINQPHTFTAVATAIPNSAAGVTIAPIAITVSPTPSSLGTVSCQAQSGNTRTCTLTINSASAGTFTANASVTVTVGTVTLNRDTDPATTDVAGPGGTGPATKTYVGGVLTWTKVDGDAQNALLAGAVFTVCGPTAQTCFDVTDNQGLDKDAAGGKFTLQNLDLGAYTVEEKTPPAGYNLITGQQTATLTTANPTAAIANAFVNRAPTASITIGPNTATNSTTEAHTFTATMTVDPRGGGTPNIGALSITVSPTPSTLGAVDCSAAQTGPDAGGLYKRSCTLQINSTSAGTFVANASASATVGIVTLNRSTDGNATLGNSGSATKIYVAPTLVITKTTANSQISAGGTATYTVTVQNTGQGKAFGVRLSDQLSTATGFSWSVGASSGWSNTCAVNATQHLDCGPVDLSPNASTSVTVSTTVPAAFVFQTPVPTPGQTKLEMDGNLVSDAATDWANSGISCVNPLVGCSLDASGSTDDSFGNGTKEDTPVPSITDGSIPPNKSDLLRFYVYNNRQTVGASVHDFVYLAWERVLNPSGTTNMDFELNQSTTLSSNGVTPVRTAGDVLIKYDLSSGGTNLSMGFHRWATAANATCEASGAKPPCWGPVQSLAGAFLGHANDPTVPVNGNVSDPLAPNAPRTLSPLTFGEASIDMQLGQIFQAGQCVSFGRAYLKSRSSDSFTAAIKDFVRPVPVSIANCVSSTIQNSATATALNASSVTSSPPTVITVNP